MLLSLFSPPNRGCIPVGHGHGAVPPRSSPAAALLQVPTLGVWLQDPPPAHPQKPKEAKSGGTAQHPRTGAAPKPLVRVPGLCGHPGGARWALCHVLRHAAWPRGRFQFCSAVEGNSAPGSWAIQAGTAGTGKEGISDGKLQTIPALTSEFPAVPPPAPLCCPPVGSSPCPGAAHPRLPTACGGPGGTWWGSWPRSPKFIRDTAWSGAAQRQGMHTHPHHPQISWDFWQRIAARVRARHPQPPNEAVSLG